MRSSLALAALLVISATAQASVSVITAWPDDPDAVYFTGAACDGTADPEIFERIQAEMNAA